MRTTITLDPDVDALLEKLIAERKLSFKQAVNFAIREGLNPPGSDRPRFTLPTFNLGDCLIPGEWNAQHLADNLEDEEILRKMALGK